MIEYPYESIQINAREVSIKSILADEVNFLSVFEQRFFAFIRNWLTGAGVFELHTSGSTGTPKIISITRKQMIASALLTKEALALKEGDTALVCLSVEYIAGIMMLVRCLEIKMKIMAIEPIADISHQLSQTKGAINFTAIVPLQLQAITALKKDNVLGMKAILVGGGVVNAVLKEAIQVLPVPIFATYGMTETISHVALQRLNVENPQPFFKCLPGITIRKDDRNCLAIRAPYLPEEIITNDIVEIISPNEFEWLGRWDNVINSGGVKIYPEKVESAIEAILKKLNIAPRFFVYGVDDEKLGQKVVLFVEGNKNDRYHQLLSILHGTLNRYEIPKEIQFIPTFAYTPTGKINRKASLL